MNDEMTPKQRYYWKNRERILEENRKYHQENKEKIIERKRKKAGAKKRSGVNQEKLRANRRRTCVAYQKRYPEKIKAHQIVRTHVRNGKLLKPDQCEICNEKKKIEAHHEDYTKPLQVRWFCRQCHVNYHRGKINELVVIRYSSEGTPSYGEVLNLGT